MADRDLKSSEYDTNPLLHWREHSGILSTFVNVIIMEISKFLPLRIKNRILRLKGVEIGDNVAIGLGVQLDVFFPENISVGSGSVIGYGSTILAHETTTDEFRKGEVVIGRDVLIGANTTVLPGVEIGDGAKVGAGSVVTSDVSDGDFVAGVPARPVE